MTKHSQQGELRQLALSLPTGLGHWLPDETLFSWCSRYHCQSVNAHTEVTRRQLFGDLSNAGAHDFPSGIDRFVQRNDGVLGSAEDIIKRRTLLAYYLPFRSRERIREAINRMRGPTVGSLKYQLGLLTSGLGAGHPLKACPTCMCEDEARFNVAYWHSIHQLPTVFLCPVHRCSLCFVELRRGRSGPVRWTLPRDCIPRDMSCKLVEESMGGKCRRLQRLAMMSRALVDADPASFADAGRLGLVFRQQLLSRKMMSRRGRVDWAKTLSAAQHHFKSGRAVHEFDCLRSLTTESGLRRVLTGRSLSHPVRYMTIIEWLFDDWGSFLTAYRMGGLVSNGQSRRCSLEAPTIHPGKQDAIAAMRSGQSSVSGAARHLGVDYATAAGWAAEANIPVNRRPKRLKSVLRSKLIQQLAVGIEKAQIVADLGVSISTVNRLLRTEPGLTEQWQQARFEKRRCRSRLAWQAALTQLPGASTCLVRQLAPAEYVWLYRHDRAWLRASIEIRTEKPIPSNNAATRMRRLDALLARAVEEAALELVNNNQVYKVRWENLVQVLPSLKKRKLDGARYPLTRRVLARLMS